MKKILVVCMLLVMLVVSTAYASTECQHENTVFYRTSAYRYRVEGDKCYGEYDTVEECRDCGAELGEGVRSEERQHFLDNGVCKSCGGTEAVSEVKAEESDQALLSNLEAAQTTSAKTGMLRVAIAIAIILFVVFVVLLCILLSSKSYNESSKPTKRKNKNRRTVTTKKRSVKSSKKISRSKRKTESSLVKLFKESFEEGRAKAKKKSEPSKHAPKHAAKAKEEMPEGTFD